MPVSNRPLCVLVAIACCNFAPLIAGDPLPEANAPLVPPLPTAPIPEPVAGSSASASANAVDVLPPSFVEHSSPCPVVTSESPCDPYSRNSTCHRRDDNRRWRLCNPDAPLNAMARLAPAGASVRGIMGMQIANGDAAQLVLYEFDFLPGEASLNCRGLVKLQQLARRLSMSPFPLLIQPTLTDPSLDRARRDAVLAALLPLEPAISPDRVLLALPPARGLGGLDAVLIHDRLLRLSAGGAPDAGVSAEAVPAAVVPLAP